MGSVTNEKAPPATRVAQGRALLDSAYSLKLSSKRILLMCLAQLNANENPSAHNGEFFISATEYRKIFGGSQPKSSTDVRAGVEELYDASVRFLLPDDDEYEEGEMRWIFRREIHDEGKSTAKHKLYFNPFVMPFMKELERGFAQYNLKDCSSLTSTNQIRLYEDLSLWRNTGWWNTTLDDFENRYQLSASLTSRPAEFKRRFLDLAIAQINTSTPLLISYSSEGRKFRFTIVDKKKAEKLGGVVAATADGE
ncbi:replication initiation protein [Escherichia coli]|nr:replication initiation protein [Escherichia coli]